MPCWASLRRKADGVLGANGIPLESRLQPEREFRVKGLFGSVVGAGGCPQGPPAGSPGLEPWSTSYRDTRQKCPSPKALLPLPAAATPSENMGNWGSDISQQTTAPGRASRPVATVRWSSTPSLLSPPIVTEPAGVFRRHCNRGGLHVETKAALCLCVALASCGFPRPLSRRGKLSTLGGSRAALSFFGRHRWN